MQEIIRPTDVLLAVLLSALGVLLMVENMHRPTGGTRIDSTSWLMIPVFLVAMLPMGGMRVDVHGGLALAVIGDALLPSVAANASTHPGQMAGMCGVAA